MAVIIPRPPDPRRRAFLDYVSRLQEERYRREQERAREREAQEQRLITGVGIAAGVVGGVALAPALGISAVAGGIQGAAVGGRIGQQFGAGDIAGGVTTAAQAAGGIMQSMQDQELYGYSPTKQEKAFYAKAALEAGTNMGQLIQVARATGSTVPEAYQVMRFSQAETDQKQEMIAEIFPWMSVPEWDAAVEKHPGGAEGLYLDGLNQQGIAEAKAAGEKQYAMVMGRGRAELHAAARRSNMELLFDPRELSQRSADHKELDEQVRTGDLTYEQAAEIVAGWTPLVPTERPRITPRTVEEEEVQSQKTGHYYIRTKNGDYRPVGSMKDENVAEGILKHQADIIKGTMGSAETYTVDQAAGDWVKAHDIAKQIESGLFQKLRDGPPTGAPVSGPPQAAAPPPPPAQPKVAPSPMAPAVDNPQLQAQLNIAADLLSRLMADFPEPENWTAEMRERFNRPAALLNKMFIEKMERGEILTPEQQQLARYAAKIIRQGT